jgi:tetratricopeptide (TPR) repeat protein
MNNTINTNTMKTKVILIAMLMTFGLGTKVMAQANECHTTLSLFVEPAKVKNYDAALPHYDKVITECPKFSLATYQYAERMFKHFIEQGQKDKVDDLIKAYQLRMQYFPAKTKEGDVLSDIAQVKYDNSIGTKMDQFNAFDEAFKKDPENFTSPKSIYTYFSLAVDLYDEGKMDIQEVFDLYDVIIQKIEREENGLAEKLTPLMEKQDAGTDLSAKEKKYMSAYETNLEAYGKVKGSVNGKLGILADCPNLIQLYEKELPNRMEDVNWLKTAAGRLNAKECETPLFFKMVQQLHNLEPSAKSAYYLGRLADREGRRGEALDYYNQAAELETDPNAKADVYYRIAENFKDKGSYGQARTYYQKAIDQKPSMGRAYLKIANMIGSSASGCGTTPFEKRAIYWKAAEMAEKAARVDATIASNARAAAESYRQRAPSKSDIFSAGMQGKTISFGNCWVGGSVRVPNL